MKKTKTKKTKKRHSSFHVFIRDVAHLDPRLLILLVLILLISLFVSQNSLDSSQKGFIFGVKTDLFEEPTIAPNPMYVPNPAFYPRKIESSVQVPDITAQAAIVIDVASQVVLYEKNAQTRLLPASTTKIMTALVGMDYFNLNDVLVVPQLTTTGAKMGLIPAEQITLENLLYGLLLNSGNDAAETIAKNSPNGDSGFVEAMNAKAKELHLTNTHFQDVAGLASENHYTNALDLARLATFALKNEKFAKIVATKRIMVTDIFGKNVHDLKNLNKLLGEVAGVIGMKTGFTEEAGQVLVVAATRDAHTIVTVVLKSDDRFADTKALLEWAFANHEFVPALSR